MIQGQIANRRRAQSDGTTQIFAGLLKCADCGWNMKFGKQSNGQHKAYYGCGKHFQAVDRRCTIHFIRYDVLYAYVLDRLQFWPALAAGDEQQLLARLLQSGGQNRAAEKKKQISELRKGRAASGNRKWKSTTASWERLICKTTKISLL